MHVGKIVELTERNSGYICQSGVKEPLFFDASDLVGGIAITDLHVGDALSYKITKSLKGPYATSVSRAEK